MSKVRVVDRVDAQHRDQRGDRRQDRRPHPQDPHEDADQRNAQDQQQQVADVHRVDDAPEQVGALRDQLRAGADAEDQQRAEQHRHRGVGRDAERQQRDERRRRGGVVGRLGGGDALDGAAAEPLGRLGARASPTAYAASEAITAPPPGSTPRKKPMHRAAADGAGGLPQVLRARARRWPTAAGTCGLPCRSSRL